jgi:hypothetical protein
MYGLIGFANRLVRTQETGHQLRLFLWFKVAKLLSKPIAVHVASLDLTKQSGNTT